ncbi:unnamed protein product [Urochloa decumbens]|uniref:Germin-like protein n=1 Tax=Urochloa decumbens TaxID=240449 RepID=A0ABC9B4U7_9POAL
MGRKTELLLLVVVLVLLLLSLLPFSSLSLNQDFCIADLAAIYTPAGYPCKPPAFVTANDFYYDGLAGSFGPPIKPSNVALGSATVAEFPGVNGLAISAARMDIAAGGAVPLHSHPGGTELVYVLEGSLVSGFVSATLNKVYAKTLRKGDLMVLPQGQLHFQYSVGNTTAVIISTFNSANPGAQVMDYALFANDLPAEVVSKVTNLDELQVVKLKALFGGSG